MTRLLPGSVWYLGTGLDSRQVRVVFAGPVVTYRNAYGRHGETRTMDRAEFLERAVFDQAASSSPKSVAVQAVPKFQRITPKQRVAAEQARARGEAA